MTITPLCYENLRDTARDGVLSALDEFARASGLPNLPHRKEGATDADLPALFRAVDAQVRILIDRSGMTLPDRLDLCAAARTAAELAASLQGPRR